MDVGPPPLRRCQPAARQRDGRLRRSRFRRPHRCGVAHQFAGRGGPCRRHGRAARHRLHARGNGEPRVGLRGRLAARHPERDAAAGDRVDRRPGPYLPRTESAAGQRQRPGRRARLRRPDRCAAGPKHAERRRGARCQRAAVRRCGDAAARRERQPGLRLRVHGAGRHAARRRAAAAHARGRLARDGAAAARAAVRADPAAGGRAAHERRGAGGGLAGARTGAVPGRGGQPPRQLHRAVRDFAAGAARRPRRRRPAALSRGHRRPPRHR